jgi:hypothetical protein
MRTHSHQPFIVLILCVVCLSEPPDGYGDNPTTAVIYDDSDYADADSPVYVSGDGANSQKFKMIKTLRYLKGLVQVQLHLQVQV